jgi:hypothetical protein
VKSARAILEALAGGERDPRVLAGLSARQVRAGIEAALEGMQFGDHHGRLTQARLDHITFLDRSTAAVEDDITATLDAIPAAQGARKLDTDRRTRSLMNQLRALHPDSEITITPAA